MRHWGDWEPRGRGREGAPAARLPPALLIKHAGEVTHTAAGTEPKSRSGEMAAWLQRGSVGEPGAGGGRVPREPCLSRHPGSGGVPEPRLFMGFNSTVRALPQLRETRIHARCSSGTGQRCGLQTSLLRILKCHRQEGLGESYPPAVRAELGVSINPALNAPVPSA